MEKKAKQDNKEERLCSFWEHLDQLRISLIRIVIITFGAAVVAFGFKEELFSVMLGPHSSDFFLFRLIGGEPFKLHLINVALTEQFMVHMKTAIYVGVLVSSPYIIYELFKFVSPALYDNERRHSASVIISGVIMFALGTALNYCVIFPFTVRFMGTYNVDPEVTNMLTLSSYIDTLLTMNILMGALFELPVISGILGRHGLVTAKFMASKRRQALVVILIVGAIITPTTDVFTLLVVCAPIMLLYEFSIMIVRLTARRRATAFEPDENPQLVPAMVGVSAQAINTDDSDDFTGPNTGATTQNIENRPQSDIDDDLLWEENRLKEWGYKK